MFSEVAESQSDTSGVTMKLDALFHELFLLGGADFSSCYSVFCSSVNLSWSDYSPFVIYYHSYFIYLLFNISFQLFIYTFLLIHYYFYWYIYIFLFIICTFYIFIWIHRILLILILFRMLAWLSFLFTISMLTKESMSDYLWLSLAN